MQSQRKFVTNENALLNFGNMKTKNFFDWQQVGFQVKTVADALQARKMGLYVCNADGLYNGYLPIDDHDNTHEMSDEEYEKILQNAMIGGGEFYACINIENAALVPKKPTMLSCDFQVGDTVFFMDNNKIHKTTVVKIVLSVSADGTEENYVLSDGTGEQWNRQGDSLFLSAEELAQHLLDEIDC